MKAPQNLERSAPSDAELLERFVSRRDERAFAALLVRHGPMVLGVCRNVLRHAQDAEDAFQATFLVLVQKAAVIGGRERLGNWLYGVAWRVAGRARQGVARRLAHEVLDPERVARAAGAAAEPGGPAGECQEEVRRLPAKYREPVVLCYLEGRTHEEAAAELRWPVGTVKGRLARARDLLRKRLTRRGLALSAGVLSGAPSHGLLAALPLGLRESTIKAALHFAAGDAAAGGLVSARAVALTKGVLHTMFMTKVKTAAALVLALAVLAGGTGVSCYMLATEPPARKADKEAIRGVWKVVSVKMNGQDAPGDEGERIKNATVEITADKLTLKSGGEERVSTYKIDPDARPKTIDITYQGEGGENGKTTPGIYALEGDTLTLCSPCGRRTERPTELVSREGSDTFEVVLKRKK